MMLECNVLQHSMIEMIRRITRYIKRIRKGTFFVRTEHRSQKSGLEVNSKVNLRFENAFSCIALSDEGAKPHN